MSIETSGSSLEPKRFETEKTYFLSCIASNLSNKKVQRLLKTAQSHLQPGPQAKLQVTEALFNEITKKTTQQEIDSPKMQHLLKIYNTLTELTSTTSKTVSSSTPILGKTITSALQNVKTATFRLCSWIISLPHKAYHFIADRLSQQTKKAKTSEEVLDALTTAQKNTEKQIRSTTDPKTKATGQST